MIFFFLVLGFVFVSYIKKGGNMDNNINLNSRLELEDRKRLSLTGVQSVDGFSEEVINLTVANSKMKVVGEKIKITSYSKNTGVLSADGVFSEIKYNYKKESLLKKIFK